MPTRLAGMMNNGSTTSASSVRRHSSDDHRDQRGDQHDDVADDAAERAGDGVLRADDVVVEAAGRRAGLGAGEERDRHPLDLGEQGDAQVVDQPLADPGRAPPLHDGQRGVGDREPTTIAASSLIMPVAVRDGVSMIALKTSGGSRAMSASTTIEPRKPKMAQRNGRAPQRNATRLLVSKPLGRLGEVDPPHGEHGEHATHGRPRRAGRRPPRRRGPSGTPRSADRSDSPSTMRVNRPNRSAMWPGCHGVPRSARPRSAPTARPRSSPRSRAPDVTGTSSRRSQPTMQTLMPAA